MNILPTLSASITLEQAKHLPWPMLGFYKYDGIRALVPPKMGVVSRKLKPIPNLKVREKFKQCIGFDGELIFGTPTDPACYNLTESQVMTRNIGADGVHFYAFDYFADGFDKMSYTARRHEMEMRGLFLKCQDLQYAPMKELKSFKELLAFEKEAVGKGYEGIMLRRPDGHYKMGRSTVRELLLMKLKRFEDIEVKILEVYPRQRNDNPKEKDERGYSKRSSHKAGKVELAEIGGFLVQEIAGRKRKHSMAPGVLTQEERRRLWKVRAKLIGKLAVCRSQPAGEKDLPRFPRFKGWRSRLDF